MNITPPPAGSTAARAQHRWREILPRLGIDTRFLTGKDTPCPICGGRDRFRFDDRDGSGSYYCRQCGPGLGIMLLRQKHSWTYAAACAEVDKIIGTAAPSPATRKTSPSPDTRRRANIENLIAEARDPSIVDAYLTRRGITARSPVLLGHSACPYRDLETHKLIGRYPAVLAPILGPDGTLQSVHRIYDAPELKPRKTTMPPVSTIAGGAVRLLEPGEELGIGEGVETCLAASELFNVPVWAALTAGGIESFEPPPGLMRLLILADNDANGRGQLAAYKLMNRLAKDSGLAVQVHVPPDVGTDWNDVLRAGGSR